MVGADASIDETENTPKPTPTRQKRRRKRPRKQYEYEHEHAPVVAALDETESEERGEARKLREIVAAGVLDVGGDKTGGVHLDRRVVQEKRERVRELGHAQRDAKTIGGDFDGLERSATDFEKQKRARVCF